jgi:phasin family protein
MWFAGLVGSPVLSVRRSGRFAGLEPSLHMWSENMTNKPKAIGAIAAVPAPGATTAAGIEAASIPVEAVQDAQTPRTFDKAVEALKQTAETANTNLSTSLEEAGTKVKQGVQSAMKTAEQLTQFHQGNLEAVVKSGQIWAAGLQDLSKHVASNAQATMEETMSTFRAMSGVKSLKEAFELQSSFARAAMEKALAESTKLTETGLKLAEQAYAPITARVNAAVDVFSTRN